MSDSSSTRSSGRASDSEVSRPPNQGVGEQVVYQTRPTADRAVDLLTAYKWPVVATAVVLVALLGLGVVEVPSVEVPPEVLSALGYAALGVWLALPLGHILLRRLWSDQGVEVLDVGPASDDHRHLRLGPDVWEDLTVRTPWGEEVGTSKLKQVTLNGRTGYEVEHLHVDDDLGLVCHSTKLGEVGAVELRTYEEALSYTRERLSKRANRATALRANMGPIIRETVEAVVYDLVRTSEESGLPNGDRIDSTVEEVLGDLDLDADPTEERADSRRSSSTRSSTSTETATASNGHQEEPVEVSLGDALDDLDRQTRTNGGGRP